MTMTGIIPFNRKSGLANNDSGFEDFYNVLDNFFSGDATPSRQLLRDTFKIDIEEKDKEYLVEAEIPGVTKEEIDLSIEDKNLLIKVNRQEETDKSSKNYVHKERRTSSMSRSIRLANANLEAITAKIDNGILQITIPKADPVITSRKIEIE